MDNHSSSLWGRWLIHGFFFNSYSSYVGFSLIVLLVYLILQIAKNKKNSYKGFALLVPSGMHLTVLEGHIYLGIFHMI